MKNFQLPGDLHFNRGVVLDPASYIKDQGCVSWLFLVGSEFAKMENGMSYCQVQAATEHSINVISDPPLTLDLDLAKQHIAALEELPRPTLITCRTGPRASAVAYMYAGWKMGAEPDEVIAVAEKDNAPFVQFEDYKAWVRSAMDNLQKEPRKHIEMESIQLVGLSMRTKTTNENGKSSFDCGNLWQKFEKENYTARIPNRAGDEIIAVYHEYEGDYTQPFSYFIGCKVAAGTETPEGMETLLVPKGLYHKFTATGKMPDCVANTWKEIWNSTIPRAYTKDFEVYGEKSRDWNNAEVEIYISVKQE